MNEDKDLDYLLYLSGQKKVFINESHENKEEDFEEEIVDAAVDNLTTIPIISLSSSSLETSLMPDKASKEDIDVDEIKKEVENLVDAVQNEENESSYDMVNIELVKHHFNEFVKSAKKLDKNKKKKIKEFLAKNLAKLF